MKKHQFKKIMLKIYIKCNRESTLEIFADQFFNIEKWVMFKQYMYKFLNGNKDIFTFFKL